jgi:cupin fold WbuC family metalloprotein
MKQIDNALLDSLTAKAKESPRKRSHFTLHADLSDPVQRLIMAMEPESYVRPHRHSDPETWEILVILRGSLVIVVFDEKGMVTDRLVLKAGGQVTAMELPQNNWHAAAALESGTIVFEVKRGPYKPIEKEHLAFWAPNEGEPPTVKFLEWYRTAKIGDLPPKL